MDLVESVVLKHPVKSFRFVLRPLASNLTEKQLIYWPSHFLFYENNTKWSGFHTTAETKSKQSAPWPIIVRFPSTETDAHALGQIELIEDSNESGVGQFEN